MLKKLSFIAVLFFVRNSFAVTDSVNLGDNGIEWLVYETEAPVKAFAVVGKKIWYATDGGVGIYDTKLNKKTQISKLGAISSAGIKSITFDGDAVWLGGSEGVVKFSGGKYTLYQTANGLPSNTIYKLRANGKKVWAGTDKGVAVYRNGTWSAFTTAAGLAGDVVRDIAFDDEDGVWFATNGGVSYYKGGTWKTYDMNSGLSSNNVKAIAYDSRITHLWIATGEQDVNDYDGKEWNTYMDIQPGITCIMTDTQSRIWFGSDDGIMKYNQMEWITDPAKVGFPAAEVHDMYRTSNGDLLFGMERGILFMKNPYPY